MEGRKLTSTIMNKDELAIECVDMADNERIRAQGRPVKENLSVK